MRRRIETVWLIGVMLVLPVSVYANGVSPVINFFHRDTWMPASVVTVVIILLESAFLRWRIKNVSYVITLWRCLLINAASSVIGSAVLILYSRDSYFVWDTMSLILPLFLVTLATEIPLLRVLYRSVSLSWRRAVKLGCLMNIFSYITVFIVEFGLLFALVVYAGHRDKKQLREWTNPDLLEQADGVICLNRPERTNTVFCIFRPEKGTWTRQVLDYFLFPQAWDIQGDVCAFVRYERGVCNSVTMYKISDHTDRQEPLASVPVRSLAEKRGNIINLAISPDQQKLALLFRVGDAVAPNNGESYYHLGSKCRLAVIGIPTGQLMLEAERWASDRGLCWLSDSQRILFSSFDDDSVYYNTENDVSGDVSYGVGYARRGMFTRSLYAVDITSGEIIHFAEGDEPSLAGETGQVLVTKNKKELNLLDSAGKLVEHIRIDDVDVDAAVVSPSSDYILIKTERRVLFYAGSRLIVLRRDEPGVRHVLDDGNFYKIKWVDGP